MIPPVLLGVLLATVPPAVPVSHRMPVLEPVRVVAARETNRPAAAAVWRFTRREIERSGARTAAEVLAAAPGVRLERRGGVAQSASLLVRGASHEQLLVLVDGVPYNPLQGGGADLSMIPAASIEAVELLRGGTAGQAIANGLAGILRITTRAAAPGEHPRLEAGMGSFGERKLGGVLPLASGGWTCRIAASHARGEGGYSYPGQATVSPDGRHTLGGAAVPFLNTGYRTSDAALTLRHDSGGVRQRLSADWLQREAGAPGSIEFPTGAAALFDRRLALQYVLASGGERAGFSGGLHALFQERRYRDFVYAPDEQRQANTSFGMETRAHFPGPGETKWETGFILRREALQAGVPGETPPDPRWAVSPALGCVLPLGTTLRIEPALRLDLASDGPALLGAGTGLVWDPDGAFSMQASFGSAFRRPSFADLFQTGTAFAAGNPLLRAERSLGGEIGLRLAPAALPWLQARCYAGHVNDWILWQPSAGGVWRPANVDGVRLSGLELEGGFRTLPAVRLLFEGSLFYTLQSARDGAGNQLPRRPRETAGGRFGVTLDRVGHLTLSAVYTGFRFLNRANSKYLDGQLVVDLGIGCEPFAGLTLQITVRNLFDHRYVDLREYPVPGREASLECLWSF